MTFIQILIIYLGEYEIVYHPKLEFPLKKCLVPPFHETSIGLYFSPCYPHTKVISNKLYNYICEYLVPTILSRKLHYSTKIPLTYELGLFCTFFSSGKH